MLKFKNLKATDLKNNKRVILPKIDDDEMEIKRNHVRNELKSIFINFKKENCDKYGNLIENNLDDVQVQTIKELKKKIDDENLVYYKTDKTGKGALNTVKNFKDNMKKKHQ